jgi:hypothetical protein
MDGMGDERGGGPRRRRRRKKEMTEREIEKKDTCPVLLL